jgi:hypothetical protein
MSLADYLRGRGSGKSTRVISRVVVPCPIVVPFSLRPLRFPFAIKTLNRRVREGIPQRTKRESNTRIASISGQTGPPGHAPSGSAIRIGAPPAMYTSSNADSNRTNFLEDGKVKWFVR